MMMMMVAKTKQVKFRRFADHSGSDGYDDGGGGGVVFDNNSYYYLQSCFKTCFVKKTKIEHEYTLLPSFFLLLSLDGGGRER